MRLWSLHPAYLDRQGLLAVWREALLAQAVLLGRTEGYRHHPQLERFRKEPSPAEAVGDYLVAIWEEAARRRYRFDRSKIEFCGGRGPMNVTAGQLRFERGWLEAKLARRAPDRLAALEGARRIEPHPSFVVVPGGVEPWEREK